MVSFPVIDFRTVFPAFHIEKARHVPAAISKSLIIFTPYIIYTRIPDCLLAFPVSSLVSEETGKLPVNAPIERIVLAFLVGCTLQSRYRTGRILQVAVHTALIEISLRQPLAVAETFVELHDAVDDGIGCMRNVKLVVRLDAEQLRIHPRLFRKPGQRHTQRIQIPKRTVGTGFH